MECEAFLTRQSDGGFVLTTCTEWQWFTDMQPPHIQGVGKVGLGGGLGE